MSTFKVNGVVVQPCVCCNVGAFFRNNLSSFTKEQRAALVFASRRIFSVRGYAMKPPGEETDDTCLCVMRDIAKRARNIACDARNASQLNNSGTPIERTST